VIGAALGSVLVWSSFQTPKTKLVGDGPTLYQAFAAVNGSVQVLSGGPWELFSYIGLAAESEFNPAAFGFAPSTNLSVRSCGAEFDGVTLWNGSAIPTFDGSIDSGTAPFWQFEFSSVTSHDVVVATDISGRVRTYLPVIPSDPCWIPAGGLAATSYFSWVNPLPEDSPIQARLAYDRVAESFESKNRPVVEIYANGFTPLAAIGHGPNGGVEFYRCGIVGVAGIQQYLVVGFSPTGQIFDIGNGTLTCTATYSIGPPPVYSPYKLVFTTPGQPRSFGGGLEGTNSSFQVSLRVGANNSTVYFDGWGLLTWMISLSLREANGSSLPSVPLSCQTWVPSPMTCSALAQGWSAILVSTSGEWQDTFPSATAGSSWAVLDAAVVSNEELWVTFPASWNVTGDVLTVSGTAPIPTVLGIATL
jgi:hypothetical protein